MIRRKGFTLLELIIVIIVIGILASIALPRFLRVTEKARTAEAKVALSTIRSSQIRYYAQYGVYHPFEPIDTSSLDCDLDEKYYTYSVLDTEIENWFGPGIVVGLAMREINLEYSLEPDTGYWIAIKEDGEFNITSIPPGTDLSYLL